MKKLFCCLIFHLLIFQANCQGKLELSGQYVGENLYFQNPEDGDGFGFCVDSVFINNLKYVDSTLNKSAFELPLSKLNLILGSTLDIKVYHKSGCKPKVLNPGPYKISKLEFLEIHLDKKGNLSWKVKNEMKGVRNSFLIERLGIDGKWSLISEVDQKWEEINDYILKINIIKGENIYRIKTLQSWNKFIFSNEVKFSID